MAERTPLVRVGGYLKDLPAGDTVAGASGSSGWTVTAKTADYTVLVGDSGTAFTNLGAGGSVTFTLPASAGCTAGETLFRFVAMDAQIIRIEPPGSDTLGIYNERDSAAQTASSGNPVGTAGTGFEYMDALYMGSGIWHGTGVGRWNV